jgi:hypothetical protein
MKIKGETLYSEIHRLICSIWNKEELPQQWKEKWEYNGMVHQLFVDFKKAYDSREVLYNIVLEFGVPKELVRLIKMCLNGTYSKVRVGKLLSGTFPIQNGLKQGNDLSPLLSWRKLHNDELHSLYSSPNIVRVIKPKRMRWA